MIELSSVRLVIQSIDVKIRHLHLGLEWQCEVSLHCRKYVVDDLLGYSVPTYYSSS